MAKEWTTPLLKEALRQRFPINKGYAILFEVADSTGWGAKRAADAIVGTMWKNLGYFLMHIEIKASRSDWLRELKDPSKAENVSKYCDFMYVLAPPGIVELGEEPKPWGVLVPHGKTLKEVKAPIQQTPTPMTPEFRASLFRAMTKGVNLEEYVAKASVQEMAAEMVRDAYQRGRNERAGELEKERDEACRKLREGLDAGAAIDRFRELTGIRIPKHTSHRDWNEVRLTMQMIQSGFLAERGNEFKATLAAMERAGNMLKILAAGWEELTGREVKTNGTGNDGGGDPGSGEHGEAEAHHPDAG